MPVSQGLNMDPRIPLYYQLMQLFRQQIEEGEYQPGDSFPSGNELCERFGVSRPTVRQALNELVREGLLHRVKGKGTFVSAPKIQQDFMQKLVSFTEEMQQKGLKGTTRVLSLQVVPALKNVAAYLTLAIEEPVFQLDRLRFINDEPIVVVTTYLPQKYCPTLNQQDLNNQSLYKTLEDQYSIRISRARRILEVIAATEEYAKLLEIDVGAPIQLSRTIAWDQYNRPIEFSIARYRGDRSQFTIDLIR
ncbi:GntR family transcriptional regulator [Neomoorella thermoacetica]|uniref:GntR family transcriptional regulator n=1 Tax=Neomoorella thermoacetica TaxID=1525 RepID=UPI000914FF45|nr:GntR family transcriptional regulator [Moorella thermoacetica]OIQ10462.1 HTH-type transcriptional repressor YvoA [Moorella thermoacetica]